MKVSMHQATYAAAALEGIVEEMRLNPEIFTIGQIVGRHANTFYPGIGQLEEEFGRGRVRPAGIIERFIAGAGVGAALAGGRALVDMSRAAFSTLAFDEIFAKAGMWRYEHGSNGDMNMRVVYRMTYDSYEPAGAEHARVGTSHFMRGVGLKVAVPTTPSDAKGLIKTALRDDDPVVFMQHRKLFEAEGQVPDDEYLVPFGEANIVREGADCTVVAVGYMVQLASEAAIVLEEQGVGVEIIDPRTLVPLDLETILASVGKTRHLVVVDEDFQRCGVGAEIGFRVQEELFDTLAGPVRRVDNPNVPVPNARNLRGVVLPTSEKIVAAVTESLRATI